MAHPLLLAIAFLIALSDARPAPASPVAQTAAWTLAPLLGAWIVAHLIIRRAGRSLDRTGSRRALWRAEAVAKAFTLYLYIHAATAFLSLGWLPAVRAAIGDRILLDEALAAAPFITALILGWWSFAPIERRLIDAALIRALDEATPVHAPPSVPQLVFDRARHSLAIGVVILAIILSWAEASLVITAALFERDVFPSLAAAQSAGTLAQLAVAVPVLVLTPLLIRILWDTVPLRASALATRIATIAQHHRVRFRRVLIWRTRGSLLNGAVVGVAGPLRYILLTDALIERLTTPQLDAVIAHEVAHVRRKHLPWLLVTTATALVLAGLAATAAVAAAPPVSGSPELIRHTAESAALVAGLIAGVLTFGAVSRRFERQADAFAAQTLSLLPTDPASSPSPRITADAVNAMTGALAAVARFNHIPQTRFGFRHGSIARRIRNLSVLVGEPAAHLPIDRTVTRIKRAALAGIAISLVGSVLLQTLG